jgi:RHS repeat-associated protein
MSNYKPNGKIGTMKQRNDNVTTTYTYDSYTTRLSSIVTSGGLQNKSFTYSDAGDIATVVENGVTYTYGYDDLHRLETETNNGGYGALTMGYDELGDITSKQVGSTILTYSYNSSHKHAVSSINGYSFNYDANGNMTSGYDFSTPSSPKLRTITSYNADNMPMSITYNGTTTTSLAYDGSGTRVAKTVGTTSTYYVSDQCELTKVGSNPATTTLYIFGGNQRVAQVVGGAVSYFYKDHLGSSSVITDSTGAVVETAIYEPFGTMRAHTPPGTGTSNYKFTDQELDAENGLYNYDARLYDPVIGRFISADTVVPIYNDPQSLNRYTYTRNNPLIYIDPAGHIPMEVFFDGAYQPGLVGYSVGFGTWTSDGTSSYNSSIIVTAGSGLKKSSLENNLKKHKYAIIIYEYYVRRFFETYPQNDYPTQQAADKMGSLWCAFWRQVLGVEFYTTTEASGNNSYMFNIPRFGGNTRLDWSVSVMMFYNKNAVSYIHSHPDPAPWRPEMGRGYFSEDDITGFDKLYDKHQNETFRFIVITEDLKVSIKTQGPKINKIKNYSNIDKIE